MKALTIQQPWASLIFTPNSTSEYFKMIETRSWKTAYRGKIAIHAAKKQNPKLLQSLSTELRTIFSDAGIHSDEDISNMPHGMVIGEVDIVDCVSIELLDGYRNKYEVAFGDWSSGRYGWVIRNPILYKEPIPAVGKLSLWDWHK